MFLLLKRRSTDTSTCIDVPAPVLPRHGFGKPDHPGLGGAVVGLPDVADDPGNRRDVDDPSLEETSKESNIVNRKQQMHFPSRSHGRDDGTFLLFIITVAAA